MEYRGKKLEDIEVILPLADGTEMKCKVSVYFTVINKEYFALKPVGEDGTIDESAAVMIYEVVEDEENNPVVVYIEDDAEYEFVANYFADKYLA